MKRSECKIIVRELKMIPTDFGDQIAEINLNEIKLQYQDLNIDPDSSQVQIVGSKVYLVIEATPRPTQQQTQKTLNILSNLR